MDLIKKGSLWFDEDGNFDHAEHFTYFISYDETSKYISDENKLVYEQMIKQYGLYGKEPDESIPLEVRCHFPQIKAIIDNKRQSSINGSKGADIKNQNKDNYFGNTKGEKQ